MRHSCVWRILLLEAEEGAFVSLLDAPPPARDAAASCTSVRAHPVLAGEPATTTSCSARQSSSTTTRREFAPESPGDFFDACGIDALLALRTKTLTPRGEGPGPRDGRPRGSAARSRRCDGRGSDGTPPRHDARQAARGDREPRLRSGSARAASSRGRQAPHRRQDLLYEGRSATVESVREDVDGRQYLLVTIDDDPAAEMHQSKGRFHYYYPDEVERLDGGER